MALIARMTRLFTADLHAVFDRLEEPDVLLKQAIREMEEELALSEQRIRFMEHEREEYARRMTDIDFDLAQTAEQIDVCFASNEEPLIRTLLKRRLEMQHLVQQLRTRANVNAKALEAERAQVDEHRRTFESLRQQADLLLDVAMRPGTPRSSTAYRAPVTDDDVEVALLQERQRRSRI